ncbi:MAG: TRAP transporter small permease [Corticimicrobacter sp.]|uniref:TRAP transporter small permease n=1 Tax=Corticimicrobacter sp. TaxID=2678536 RepID=UPI0032DBE369
MPLLDRLATLSGFVAALFLAMIGIVVAAQIVGRLMGHQIPGADDLAAWSMAASVFLALPYTLLRGDHIRVTLLLQFLPERAVKPYEVVATLIGFALSAWGAWSVSEFVYESYVYNEVAQGMLNVPLWPVQICMPIGMILLAAIMFKRLIACIRGQQIERVEGASHG